MQKLIVSSLLVIGFTFAPNTYAGWWETLFGTQEKEVVDVEPAQQVAPTPETSKAIKKELTEKVTSAASQSLVALVTEKTGVSEGQATGGLGAIFKTAKGVLSGEDFGSIAQAVPEMDTLLAAAPEKQETNSLVGGLLAGAGKAGELVGLFDQLGLSPDQISSFTSLIQQYFSSAEKPELSQLLMKGIGTFL